MEERLRFVHDVLSQRFEMREPCERYGVSRKTGYKWVKRYEADGRRGLTDQSRAPRACPHRTAAHIADLLVTFRREHPLWGARKLLRVLRKRHTDVRTWPAPSTVAELLTRHGLVTKRRRRRPSIHPGRMR